MLSLISVRLLLGTSRPPSTAGVLAEGSAQHAQGSCQTGSTERLSCTAVCFFPKLELFSPIRSTSRSPISDALSSSWSLHRAPPAAKGQSLGPQQPQAICELGPAQLSPTHRAHLIPCALGCVRSSRAGRAAGTGGSFLPEGAHPRFVSSQGLASTSSSDSGGRCSLCSPKAPRAAGCDHGEPNPNPTAG